MSYPDNATASLAQFLFRDSQGAMYIIPRRAFHNGSQYGDTVTIVQDLSGNGNDLTGTAVFDRKPFFYVTDQGTLDNIRDAQIIRDVDMVAPVGNLGAGCTVVRAEPGWPVEFDELEINGNYQVTEDFSILIIIDRALTESEVRVIEEMGKKWGGATFNPLVNYANGEQGAYYAPWDISTLWQDDARTIPVENYGDPVRVMDDLSPNGNHATAPTSTARGTYGRMPVGGVRNLVLESETFSGTSWVAARTQLTELTDGYRVTIPANHGTTVYALYSDISDILPQGVTATTYFDVRRGNWDFVGVTFNGQTTLGDQNAWFNLSTLESGGGSNVTTEVKVMGDGWLRLSCTVDSLSIGSSTRRPSIKFLGGETGQNFNPITGDEYFDIRLAQAELGEETPYQRVVNEYDVSQAGVPDVYYVETDGIDDCYQTAPIDLTMWDSTSLAMGVQYLGEVGGGVAGMLVELSHNITQNDGVYRIIRAGGRNKEWGADHKGTASANLWDSTTVDHRVSVLSISASISEPDLTAVLQGELLNTTASQGTGNLGDYSLNLFSRNTTTNFLQGRFFGAIIVHPRSPYEEQNRQFLAEKAGVTL